MTKTLIPSNHTTFESAYIIPDYPYGFRLRCKMAIWIETKKGEQRVVRCTTNPKVSGEIWNKPKASTYDKIKVLFVDNESGHVESDGIHEYNLLDKAESFLREYGEILTQAQKDDLTVYSASNRVQEIQDVRLMRDGQVKFYTALNTELRNIGRDELQKKYTFKSTESGEIFKTWEEV